MWAGKILSNYINQIRDAQLYLKKVWTLAGHRNVIYGLRIDSDTKHSACRQTTRPGRYFHGNRFALLNQSMWEPLARQSSPHQWVRAIFVSGPRNCLFSSTKCASTTSWTKAQLRIDRSLRQSDCFLHIVAFSRSTQGGEFIFAIGCSFAALFLIFSAHFAGEK